MASPSELTLDCKPRTYSMLLKSFGDQNDQTQKLEEFLSRLEDEKLKIDAFKRELPLCMQLLSNAVETSRQQLQVYRENQGQIRPILEEFIPLKNCNSSETLEKSSTVSDKANWMTTAQLWSQENNETKPQTITTPFTSPKETSIGINVSHKLGLDTKQRNGGAFLPFSKERNYSSCPSPTLALTSSDHKDLMEDNKICSETENGFSCSKRENNGMIEQAKGNGDGQANTSPTNNSQAHRKARRCWSPDLHRRFVNALQMLGGSQVATPKQIRELMKVDGLTNDEVKSHLQKYRLHTRRPSPSPQQPGAPPPQLVVLGSIWVPPEYATGGAQALYSPHHHHHHQVSHAPPPHFCAAPQDFYTAPSPPPPPHHQLHHHAFNHQLHMYNKATSQAHSSPESDMRGTGDRSESIEDGKSESSSWKAESGDNGAERKGLAALREDGEESNGSEITLKF
ncbi:myb family transcription factor EFM [Mercurialis annua]|uniref:myb family transcription factor EFM n=1 Tax=Mercurialis annua TaxID=3986 RepID=UPI00215E9DC8|nr:myb family transcription factor EFM [Mercurialis annua]